MRKPFEFNKRLIVITASIIIAALSALIFCLMNPLKTNSQNQTAEGISFDNNAVAYNLDASAEQSIGGISVPGYSTVYFPQGEQIVPITLWNPEKNTCLFQFELYIGEESTNCRHRADTSRYGGKNCYTGVWIECGRIHAENQSEHF